MSIEATPFWPPDFLAEIQRLNLEKPNAPITLVLTASYDAQNFMNNPTIQFHILTWAKTHRIALKTFQHISEIKLEIDRWNKQVENLMITSHGTDKTISTSSQNLHDHIDASLLGGLHPSAKIFFYSCRTGNELAPELAKNLPETMTVFAPTDSMCPIATTLSFCPTHQQVEMKSYTQGNQHVARFSRNQPPIVCEQEDCQDFIPLLQYLSNQAKKGDIGAQFSIGYIYDVFRKDELAEREYLIAANLGHCAAQQNLGGLYFNQAVHLKADPHESPAKIHLLQEKAKFWFSQGAEQNNGKCSFYLGVIAENEGDFEKAEIHFRKAADLDHPEAWLRLGDIYLKMYQRLESDRSAKMDQFQMNLHKADLCYRMAANLAVPEAEERLRDLQNLTTDFSAAQILYSMSHP